MRTSIRTQLLAAFLLLSVVVAAGLSVYFLTSIEAYGLRKLEERLYNQARTTSALLTAVYETAGGSGTGVVDRVRARTVAQALQTAGQQTSTRLRVLDARGVVVADSAGTGSVGSNYGTRHEVASALRGQYGAATRQPEQGRIALYVTAPISFGGRIVGVTYASSTTFSILTLLRDYRTQLAVLVAIYLAVALVIAELLARSLTRPLRRLELSAGKLARDHSVRVEPSGPRETRTLAEAFNGLATEIETSDHELRAEEKRKSRFISDVSHELRTPLTAIRGAAETLESGDVAQEDAKRFLGTIVTEADRLARLANDLMILQRIEGATGELPLRRTNLREVADLAAQALEPVAVGRGVAVVVDGSAPMVLGDKDRLQQVIANLVDNATRISPRGSTVTVRLSGTDDDAIVAVADEGPGIPEGDLASLFERFYRSEMSRDRTSGGAGLGLAIVRAIVTAHSGSIEAANRPEGGAVFTVRLPALKR